MKERRRFGSEVEREAREAELVPAGEEDDSAGDALEALLRPPSTFAEDRIYRSIVQRIADEREARQAESGMSAGRADFEGGSSKNNNEKDGVHAVEDDLAARPDKTKYALSPAETVQSYRLLGMWRELRSDVRQMEEDLGMRGATPPRGTGGGSSRCSCTRRTRRTRRRRDGPSGRGLPGCSGRDWRRTMFQQSTISSGEPGIAGRSMHHTRRIDDSVTVASGITNTMTNE